MSARRFNEIIGMLEALDKRLTVLEQKMQKDAKPNEQPRRRGRGRPRKIPEAPS